MKLKRLVLPSLFLLIIAWFLFAYREAHQIKVNILEISLACLPPELQGFRILLMSDLHLGNDSAFTEQLRDSVNSVNADMLLIAGDFKDLYADEKTATSRLLQLLPAFQKFQHLYVVNGNLDTRAMMLEIETLGIRVLRNERAIVKRGDAVLGIAGVSYPYSTAGLNRSLQRFQDTRRGKPIPDCEVLLAHSPDVLLQDAARQADLVLAGHTHGGQIRIPLVGPVITKTRLGRGYASGLFTFGKTQLFITRGVGTTYVPLRFLSPPEIVLITLKSKVEGRKSKLSHEFHKFHEVKLGR